MCPPSNHQVKCKRRLYTTTTRTSQIRCSCLGDPHVSTNPCRLYYLNGWLGEMLMGSAYLLGREEIYKRARWRFGPETWERCRFVVHPKTVGEHVGITQD
jgi:hypothetical protein